MSDDYTPSMHDIRTTWIAAHTSVESPIEVVARYEAMFNRALAVHDAEVRRAALLGAAQIAESRRQMPGGAGTDGSVYMYEQDVYPHEGRRIGRAIREEADRG